MTRVVRSVLAAGSAVFVLLVPVPPASACSCADAPVAAHLQNATVAFVGRAEDTKEAPEGLVTRFRVTTVYKGKPVGDAEVTTADNEAACGVPFVEGRTYAVFAQDQAGTLTTTLCAGTTDDLASISELTPVAGPPTPSSRSAPDERPSGASRTAPIAVAGLLVALISAASALAVRASRRPRPIA